MEALISHLFLEQADQEMAKICQEILSKSPQGDLPLLRQEIKRAESSVWYNGATHNKVKLTSAKYCPDCQSQTHDKKDCWGPCDHCKKRGHKSSDCRYKDNGFAKRAEEEEKKKQETAAKMAKKAAKCKNGKSGNGKRKESLIQLGR